MMTEVHTSFDRCEKQVLWISRRPVTGDQRHNKGQETSRLIVAVNSDASSERLKGPGRPINSENDRAMVLAAGKNTSRVVDVLRGKASRS
jgi:hypothetical protein